MKTCADEKGQSGNVHCNLYNKWIQKDATEPKISEFQMKTEHLIVFEDESLRMMYQCKQIVCI